MGRVYYIDAMYLLCLMTSTNIGHEYGLCMTNQRSAVRPERRDSGCREQRSTSGLYDIQRYQSIFHYVTVSETCGKPSASLESVSGRSWGAICDRFNDSGAESFAAREKSCDFCPDVDKPLVDGHEAERCSGSEFDVPIPLVLLKELRWRWCGTSTGIMPATPFAPCGVSSTPRSRLGPEAEWGIVRDRVSTRHER